MVPAQRAEPSGRAEEPPRVVLFQPAAQGKAREEPPSLPSPGASWGSAESRARRASSHGWSRLPALPELPVSALLAALSWTRSGSAKSGLALPSARGPVAVEQAPRAAAAGGPVAAGRAQRAAARRSPAWGDLEMRWEPEGRETRRETGGQGLAAVQPGCPPARGDSPRLRHGRGRWPGRSRLAQQARRPLRGEDLQSAHSRRDAHEPSNEAQHNDVEGERARHADAACHCWGAPPGVDGQGSGCPWEAGPGSVMSPLLPRVPAFAYGLLRVSESPPARLRVSPRSGEPASAGLETGTS